MKVTKNKINLLIYDSIATLSCVLSIFCERQSKLSCSHAAENILISFVFCYSDIKNWGEKICSLGNSTTNWKLKRGLGYHNV